MKDVIERMLKVEEEARTILAEAEQEAARVGEAGRREAVERSDAMRVQAHAEATKQLELSREELARRREERLADFDRANADYAGRVRPRIGAAAEGVVRRVLGG